MKIYIIINNDQYELIQDGILKVLWRSEEAVNLLEEKNDWECEIVMVEILKWRNYEKRYKKNSKEKRFSGI